MNKIDIYKEELEELPGIEKELFKKTFYSILVKSKGFCPHEISGSLQQAITVTQIGALTFISKECYFHYINVD